MSLGDYILLGLVGFELKCPRQFELLSQDGVDQLAEPNRNVFLTALEKGKSDVRVGL